MLRQFLTNASVYPALLAIDEELAVKHQAMACPQCGGRLHVANYPRKPRGLIDLPGGCHFRFSFCCANEGCRLRETPPSVRFFDHKVYLGVVITLLTALTHGMGEHHRRKLVQPLGVDRRTLGRWQQWWRDAVARSAFWKEARARFMPPPGDDTLPNSLLERFAIDSIDALARLLHFLKPLSTHFAL